MQKADHQKRAPKAVVHQRTGSEAVEDSRKYGLLLGALKGVRWSVDAETRAKIDAVLREVGEQADGTWLSLAEDQVPAGELSHDVINEHFWELTKPQNSPLLP